MSRSRKKQGIIKDKGYPKHLYNRRFRRVNKLRVRLGKEPKLLRESINGYCVCDYKFRWSETSFYWFQVTEEETPEEYIKRKRLYFGK